MGARLEKIDFNLLPVLDAVLCYRSVSRAAAAVGLSKPAVSHALARIRAQMRDPVLVRAGQTWVLTDHAEALAPKVRALLLEARGVLSAARPFDPAELRREFRIHATDQMLSLLGCPVGHTVTAIAPHVALRFLPMQHDTPVALRREADLALGAFQELPADLHTQKLFDDRYACVVRRGHPTVRGKLTLDQYLALRHVVVAPRGELDDVVDEALRDKKLSRRAARWVPYYGSALEVVASSDCCVTLSERFATSHAQRFDLQVLRPPLALPDCAGSHVWHARVHADPAHAWLRALVARVAGEARRRFVA